MTSSWFRRLALAFVVASSGCSLVPKVDGVSALDLTSRQVADAAQSAFSAGESAYAADLAEHVLKTDFDFDDLEAMRFIAAEGRFQSGDLREALPHYRRLLDEFPQTTHDRIVCKRAFAIGKQFLAAPRTWFGDFGTERDVGIEALTFLVTKFPRSDLADDAWKELAQTFFDDRQYQAAADVWERLVREYPDSEWTDLALYRVASAYRLQTRGQSFDADPLLRAHAALERYLTRYPDGNFVADAKRERAELEDLIAQRELDIAQFYADRDVVVGERLHRANAALRFPKSGTAQGVDASELDEHSADLLKPRADRPKWEQEIRPKPADDEDGNGL